MKLHYLYICFNVANFQATTPSEAAESGVRVDVNSFPNPWADVDLGPRPALHLVASSNNPAPHPPSYVNWT